MKVTITVSPNFYFDDINFIKSLVNSHGWSFDTNDVTEIDCSASEIVSLKGIEIFSNLRKLSCNANQISEIDLSSLKYLEELQCRDNKLNKIDLRLLHNLQLIDCRGNNLIDSSDILLSPCFNGILLIK